MKTVLFLLLVLLASTAQAAECDGVSAVPVLDLSAPGAKSSLCFPATFEDGTAIPEELVLTCSLTWIDGSGATLSMQDFEGGPGTNHVLTIPRDGIGTAEGRCTLGGLQSDARLTTVVYPPHVLPAPVIYQSR